MGMAPDDAVRLQMPGEFRLLSASQLLDHAFPEDLARRREMAAQFDPGTENYRANPDLPEIYAVFLAVCEEWRDWRCAIGVTWTDGASVDLAAQVSGLLPSGSDAPLLVWRLEQQYRALEYAVRHGLWESSGDLLDWMRTLTALYFIDKHEAEVTPDVVAGAGLHKAVNSLMSLGFVGQGDDVQCAGTPPLVITPEGREYIAALLEETENLIEQFDHYKDTVIDAELDTAVFDTSRGVDLRVEAFLAEGLDPFRAVFLLRLYDGTFDHRLRDWQDAIEDLEFYEGILEPVVNRQGASPSDMVLVIESGLSLLEERQELARRERAEQDLLRRAGRPPADTAP